MKLLLKGFVLVVGLLLGEFSAHVSSTSYILPSSDPNLIKFTYFSGTANGNEIVYNDADSLAVSGFMPNSYTRILIDGFLSNSSNSMMTMILRQTFVNVKPNDNTIVVDWGQLSGGTSGFTTTSLTLGAALALYPVVMTNIPIVGCRVANFTSFLGVNPSSIHIVGHSMGAHIAGVAGNEVQTQQGGAYINRITGLDPAGPLEIYGPGIVDLPEEYMLDSSDAAWVDVVHTGRGLTSPLGVPIQGTGLGTVATGVGDVDTYVNGGANQPGCGPDLTNPASIVIASCDHYYSWRWWNSSITQTKNGYPCNDGLLGNCFSGTTRGKSINVAFTMTYGTSGAYYTKDNNTYTG